ncbi:MAG: DUF550 domain-containing protein [Ectothiorhodospiraceae bacterium]|nr:DUF550 domain-containing protein [Ectothiorhodospiraceae bacterium]
MGEPVAETVHLVFENGQFLGCFASPEAASRLADARQAYAEKNGHKRTLEVREYVPTAAVPAVSTAGFNFYEHLQRQRDWSRRTFGPGPRLLGIIDHIKKELVEIAADPLDVEEWIDVVILALDGAWRTGAAPHEIIAHLTGKQAKNEQREWPDWRSMPTDRAIEHNRTSETPDSLEIPRELRRHD